MSQSDTSCPLAVRVARSPPSSTMPPSPVAWMRQRTTRCPVPPRTMTARAPDAVDRASLDAYLPAALDRDRVAARGLEAEALQADVGRARDLDERRLEPGEEPTPRRLLGRPDVEPQVTPVDEVLARTVQLLEQVLHVEGRAALHAVAVRRAEEDLTRFRIDLGKRQALVRPVVEPVAVDPRVLGVHPTRGPRALVPEARRAVARVAVPWSGSGVEHLAGSREALVRPTGQRERPAALEQLGGRRPDRTTEPPRLDGGQSVDPERAQVDDADVQPRGVVGQARERRRVLQADQAFGWDLDRPVEHDLLARGGPDPDRCVRRTPVLSPEAEGLRAWVPSRAQDDLGAPDESAPRGP